VTQHATNVQADIFNAMQKSSTGGSGAGGRSSSISIESLQPHINAAHHGGGAVGGVDSRAVSTDIDRRSSAGIATTAARQHQAPVTRASVTAVPAVASGTPIVGPPLSMSNSSSNENYLQ